MSEIGAGDSALIADDDPVSLAQMARHLMDDVYQTPGQPRARLDADAERQTADDRELGQDRPVHLGRDRRAGAPARAHGRHQRPRTR